MKAGPRVMPQKEALWNLLDGGCGQTHCDGSEDAQNAWSHGALCSYLPTSNVHVTVSR